MLSELWSSLYDDQDNEGSTSKLGEGLEDNGTEATGCGFVDEVEGPVEPGRSRAIPGSCGVNDDCWLFCFACLIVSLDRSAGRSDPTDVIGGRMYGGNCSASTCEPSISVLIVTGTASTGPFSEDRSM